MRDSRETGSRHAALARICQMFHVATLYVFDSRADDALAWVKGEKQIFEHGPSDVDIGVRPVPGMSLAVEEKVRLAIALEDLFDVGEVDVVFLPEADPFLAANVARGERLYARDEYKADEYGLYVLRRAGDLIPLERERMALVLGERR
jgi:predicted nucleotidyltransferase